jgi:hypothetical protein
MLEKGGFERGLIGWPVYRPKFPYVSKCAYNGFIKIEFITGLYTMRDLKPSGITTF